MKLCKMACGVTVMMTVVFGLAVQSKASETLAPSNQWEFQFMPYAWVLFLQGETGLGANSKDFNTNLFEVVDKADELYAFMSYQEMRKGRLTLFADVFWNRIKIKDSGFRSFNPVAGLNLNIVAEGKAWLDLAIIEPGVAYEIGSWGGSHASLKDEGAFAPTTTLDILGGVRYWYLRPDIDLNVTATVNIPALGLSRTGAGSVSAAKTVDWFDPFIGMRLRHQLAPGQEIMLRGDIGGFDIGSDFTWQAQAGYSFDTTLFGRDMMAYLGYRALYIDYEEGNGSRKFGLELLSHGPTMGVTFKW